VKYTFWKDGREDAVNPGWSVVKGPGANPSQYCRGHRQRFERKEERLMKMKTLAMVYLTATALLLSGCVSQQKYNALDQEYQQLQQSMTAEVGA
jgi:hypothetical protein